MKFVEFITTVSANVTCGPSQRAALFGAPPVLPVFMTQRIIKVLQKLIHPPFMAVDFLLDFNTIFFREFPMSVTGSVRRRCLTSRRCFREDFVDELKGIASADIRHTHFIAMWIAARLFEFVINVAHVEILCKVHPYSGFAPINLKHHFLHASQSLVFRSPSRRCPAISAAISICSRWDLIVLILPARFGLAPERPRTMTDSDRRSEDDQRVWRSRRPS